MFLNEEKNGLWRRKIRNERGYPIMSLPRELKSFMSREVVLERIGINPFQYSLSLVTHSADKTNENNAQSQRKKHPADIQGNRGQ